MNRLSAHLLLVAFLVAIHAGALVALLWYFSWGWLLVTIAAWQFFGLIGVSVCLHREITHRAFVSVLPLKIFHLTCALIAGQAGPVVWATVHRTHHKYADTERDIHSPRQGFWAAHLGWLFQRQKRQRMTEFQQAPKDLTGDRLLQFFFFIHFPAQFLIFALLYAWGGWPAVCWLGCFRIALTLHSAWSINSLGHLYGYRNYDTPDQSTNSRVLAMFTGGEGFHNNHHQYPGAAKLSHRAGEVDPGFLYIKLMQSLGLISNLQTAARSSARVAQTDNASILQ